MNYSHLIETTSSDSEFRTWSMLALGFTKDDLTEKEKRVYAQSQRLEKDLEAKRNARELKCALEAFERLRDIPGMPEEAIDILRKWTTRDGDDEYLED